MMNENLKYSSLQDLLEAGILTTAKLPTKNSFDPSLEKYAITLIEHDYPGKTPLLYNSVYEALGLSIRNIMMVGDSKNAAIILESLKLDSRYIGGGAGVGFKDTLVEHLDDLDDTAKQTQSVNFMQKDSEGHMKGYTTDGLGFVSGLKERDSSLEGKTVLMLGSGGTGNSVAFALAQEVKFLKIVNRTVEKAQALAEAINKKYGEEKVTAFGEEYIEKLALEADVIVNVSTKGASGKLEEYSALAIAEMPVSKESIQKNHDDSKKNIEQLKDSVIVADIVLGKKDTPMIVQAKEANLQTMDGLPMVIHQAVEAFAVLHEDLFLEKKINKEKVFEIMLKALMA